MYMFGAVGETHTHVTQLTITLIFVKFIAKLNVLNTNESATLLASYFRPISKHSASAITF